ncbi:MAG: Ig-like domain-containing protein [Acidimicrobiales bacterium]
MAGGNTVTTISVKPVSPVSGDLITFGVTVTGKTGTGARTPSGDVRVSNGTQSCLASLVGSKGVAAGECKMSIQSAGKYSFFAAYPGASAFNASVSKRRLVTVS